MSDVVSGSGDSVIFWDHKSLRRKKNAQPFAHTEPPSSITWNAHNTCLAMVPRKGDTVAMCDMHDGAMNWMHLRNSISGDFTCGCLLRSKYFASGSSDSIVRIWDLKTKDVFRVFHGHTSPVRTLCRSSRDNWLVSGGEDGAVLMHVVDSTSSPSHILQKPRPGQLDVAVNRIKFSLMDRTKFGSAHDGGWTYLWSVESQRQLIDFNEHTGMVTDLCFSPSNTMLMISVGTDTRVRCYDIQNRTVVQSEVNAPAPLCSCTLLKDGVTLLVGAENGVIYAYDLRTIKYPKSTLYGHKSAVTSIAQQGKSSSSSSRSSPRSPARRTKQRSDIVGRAESGDSLSDVHSNTSSPVMNSHHNHHLVKEEEEGIPTDAEDGTRENAGVVTNDITAPPSRDNTMAVNVIDEDRVMATPIMDDTTHLNSIFSPIDPNLVTPLTRHHPLATVAAPSSALDSITFAYHPTSITPTTSEVTAQLASSSSSLSSQVAPVPIFTTSSSSTPISSSSTFFSMSPTTQTASPQSMSTETSDLFSPLPDSSSSTSRLGSVRQPVASPLLISRSKSGSITVDNSLGQLTQSKDIAQRSSGTSTDTPCSAPTTNKMSHSNEDLLPTRTTQNPSCQSVDYPDSAFAATKEVVHSCGYPLPTRSRETPLMVDAVSSGRSSAVGGLGTAGAHHFSSANTCIPSSSQDATPPINDIQMRFIEKFIRDAHEQTRESLHGDVKAISVDFIRLFHTLTHQISVLTERMDKLAQDVEYLKSRDPMYPYLPKH